MEEKVKELMVLIHTYGNHRELSGYFQEEIESVSLTHSVKADRKYDEIESKLRELLSK